MPRCRHSLPLKHLLSMDYYRYRFTVEPPYLDTLTALLSRYPFDAFEEWEYGLDAFIPADQAPQDFDAFYREIRSYINTDIAYTFLPSQNWNAVWESNFQPVLVDDFCGVRAEFHAPLQGVQHELVIQPRMAFGTGHHATTEMMVRAMQGLSFVNARVLDFGCGTGILAILAAKLGAAHIDAVDIEEESYQNTIDNAARNGVPYIQAYCGELDAVPPGHYDIILANINRHVLLQYMPDMANRLLPGGSLLLSGILKADESLVSDAARNAGLQQSAQLQKEDWMCMQWLRIR